MDVVKEPLKEDTTLLMQVKVAFHESYGLSLQIMDIDPNYSLGELHKERLETIKKLQTKGILNNNQHVDFPLLPKRLAVISAASSKGLSDFYQVIENNDWGYQFFTMLFQAYLQGDLAANSIRNQLESIKKVIHHFDAVVIVRGGGGEVGLSCYNNYDLCEAIAEFPIPVLTGIGHSTNLTVAEMIAFRNAITPTELGDFLIQSFHAFADPVIRSEETIIREARDLIKNEQRSLKSLSEIFSLKLSNALDQEKYRLRRTARAVSHETSRVMVRNRTRIEQFKVRSINGSKRLIEHAEDELENAIEFIRKDSSKIVEANRLQIDQLAKIVQLMDPVHVLKRGYSITTINGKLVDQSDIKKGTIIQTRTANFSIESEIQSIEENE